MYFPTLGPVRLRPPNLANVVPATTISYAETWMFVVGDGAAGWCFRAPQGAAPICGSFG